MTAFSFTIIFFLSDDVTLLRAYICMDLLRRGQFGALGKVLCAMGAPFSSATMSTVWKPSGSKPSIYLHGNWFYS